MDKTTVWKILIVLVSLSLIIFLIVHSFHVRKSDPSSDESGKASLSGQDWSCETFTGIPCGGSTTMSIIKGDKAIFVYDGRTSWTCTDINRQESEIFTVPKMISTNDTFIVKAKCMDINYRPHLPLTPCITNFEICIEDPTVPAATLTCRYLKDFRHIGNHDAYVDSQNATCSTNETVYTYYMDTGYSTTKIEYSNEKIRLTKPLILDS